MEFRHATAHDEVQQRRPGTRCARFGEGERFKLENGGPPGEGFGHALHQRELLGAREQELSDAIPLGIDDRFQMTEQRGGILHLVQDHRGRMPLEKHRRLLLGLLRLAGQVQGDEVMLRKQTPQGGGLARLSRAGEDDHGAGGRQLPEAGFDRP